MSMDEDMRLGCYEFCKYFPENALMKRHDI